MKLIGDLTDRNIATLSEDEVEAFIDRECAEDGVRLLPPQPEPPEPLGVAADVPVFVVGDFKFYTEEDAQRVAALVNEIGTLETYYLEGMYAYKGPQGVKGVDDARVVRREAYWSTQQHDIHKTAIVRHREQKEIFDKAKQEYDECFKDRERVSEHVWEIVRDVKSEAYRKERRIAEHAEYMGIVDDAETAFTCMVKAGRVSDTEDARLELGLPAVSPGNMDCAAAELPSQTKSEPYEEAPSS